MSYEQLSLNSFIKEMKEVSVGTHPRRFCFILGAGASRSSGIKSGQELVKVWDKELQERNENEYNRWRAQLSITDNNMFEFYSQYYEKRFNRCPTDGYNFIEKIMDSAKPSAGYVMLAHMLTKTSHNVVITTNFDHLTEDAVNYYAQNTPLVLGHESLSHYVSGLPVRPTIIKIHRDLLFDPKSRAEDLEKLPDSWKNALGLIFENYHPIFIGYAGNDKSLMDFLVENGEKFATDKWKYPYWMLYKNDFIEGKVKEFLEKSEGYYIKHGGFDDVMIQLGANFDYKIPTEDEFLGDARKRYKALADAIDALSGIPKTIDKSEAIFPDGSNALESKKETEELLDENSEFEQAIKKITSNSEIQRNYRDAIALYEEENYEKAAEIMRELIKIEPDNARYHSTHGDILKGLGEKHEAVKEYKTAIGIEPNNSSYHFCLADLLDDMNFNEEALAEYGKAIELDPDDDLSVFFASILLESMERYDEALAGYQRAVEINPKSDINHYKVAELLEKIHRYEEALVSIKKAIDIEPDYKMYQRLLKSILDKLGDSEKKESLVGNDS